MNNNRRVINPRGALSIFSASGREYRLNSGEIAVTEVDGTQLCIHGLGCDSGLMLHGQGKNLVARLRLSDNGNELAAVISEQFNMEEPMKAFFFTALEDTYTMARVPVDQALKETKFSGTILTYIGVNGEHVFSMLQDGTPNLYYGTPEEQVFENGVLIKTTGRPQVSINRFLPNGIDRL